MTSTNKSEISVTSKDVLDLLKNIRPTLKQLPVLTSILHKSGIKTKNLFKIVQGGQASHKYLYEDPENMTLKISGFLMKIKDNDLDLDLTEDQLMTLIVKIISAVGNNVRGVGTRILEIFYKDFRKTLIESGIKRYTTLVKSSKTEILEPLFGPQNARDVNRETRYESNKGVIKTALSNLPKNDYIRTAVIIEFASESLGFESEDARLKSKEIDPHSQLSGIYADLYVPLLRWFPGLYSWNQIKFLHQNIRSEVDGEEGPPYAFYAGSTKISQSIKSLDPILSAILFKIKPKKKSMLNKKIVVKGILKRKIVTKEIATQITIQKLFEENFPNIELDTIEIKDRRRIDPLFWKARSIEEMSIKNYDNISFPSFTYERDWMKTRRLNASNIKLSSKRLQYIELNCFNLSELNVSECKKLNYLKIDNNEDTKLKIITAKVDIDEETELEYQLNHIIYNGKFITRSNSLVDWENNIYERNKIESPIELKLNNVDNELYSGLHSLVKEYNDKDLDEKSKYSEIFINSSEYLKYSLDIIKKSKLQKKTPEKEKESEDLDEEVKESDEKKTPEKEKESEDLDEEVKESDEKKDEEKESKEMGDLDEEITEVDGGGDEEKESEEMEDLDEEITEVDGGGDEEKESEEMEDSVSPKTYDPMSEDESTRADPYGLFDLGGGKNVTDLLRNDGIINLKISENCGKKYLVLSHDNSKEKNSYDGLIKEKCSLDSIKIGVEKKGEKRKRSTKKEMEKEKKYKEDQLAVRKRAEEKRRNVLKEFNRGEYLVELDLDEKELQNLINELKLNTIIPKKNILELREVNDKKIWKYFGLEKLPDSIKNNTYGNNIYSDCTEFYKTVVSIPFEYAEEYTEKYKSLNLDKKDIFNTERKGAISKKAEDNKASRSKQLRSIMRKYTQDTGLYRALYEESTRRKFDISLIKGFHIEMLYNAGSNVLNAVKTLFGSELMEKFSGIFSIKSSADGSRLDFKDVIVDASIKHRKYVNVFPLAILLYRELALSQINIKLRGSKVYRVAIKNVRYVDFHAVNKLFAPQEIQILNAKKVFGKKFERNQRNLIELRIFADNVVLDLSNLSRLALLQINYSERNPKKYLSSNIVIKNIPISATIIGLGKLKYPKDVIDEILSEQRKEVYTDDKIDKSLIDNYKMLFKPFIVSRKEGEK